MTRRLMAAAFVAVAVSSVPTFAAVEKYSAVLSGLNEQPANGSPATGFVTVEIDTVTHMMRVQSTFSGLTGTTTANHIHAPINPATNLAGVATTTPSFPGFPLGVTSGTFDMTYDMSLSTSYNASYITANGGTVASAEAAFYNHLASGLAYYNIHTSTFGGGEIRGTLIPEPTALATLAPVGALALRRRRRM